MSPVRKAALMFALAAVAFVATVIGLNLRGEDALPAAAQGTGTDARTIARGAYLARAGNCIGCHTRRGGAAYAGGRDIATPFGTFFGPNLTPDETTGLGRWTEPEFWRAMHNGRSKDGHLLYPAFPYPNFTRISREDSAAIYAYLRSLPPVRQANRAHQLLFPYDQQAALAVWRALYFQPGSYQPDARQPADWNRGAYLVQGLGHCSACHAERDALGASVNELRLAGGLIPVQKWFAPSLALAEGAQPDFVALLKTGTSPHGTVMGPMADVVYRSTAFLADEDLRAMAAYLRTVEPVAGRRTTSKREANAKLGGQLYADRCASCHGDKGEGQASLYPALAGNPSVMQPAPNNVIKAILLGGFAPATAGNPRPAGMPPFLQTLDETEIAAVASFVRQSWGNAAPPVSALDVLLAR